MFGISKSNRPPRLPLLRHTACYLAEGVKVQLRDLSCMFLFEMAAIFLVSWTRFICGKLHEIEPKSGGRADTLRRVDQGQQTCPGNEMAWPLYKAKLAPMVALVYKRYSTMITSMYVIWEPTCWLTGASQAPPSPVEVYDGSPQLCTAVMSFRLVHHHLHAVEPLLRHFDPLIGLRHHTLYQGDEVHHTHVVLQPQRLTQFGLEAESKAIRELPCFHPTWAINTPCCAHNEATSKQFMFMFTSWAKLIIFSSKKKGLRFQTMWPCSTDKRANGFGHVHSTYINVICSDESKQFKAYFILLRLLRSAADVSLLWPKQALISPCNSRHLDHTGGKKIWRKSKICK